MTDNEVGGTPPVSMVLKPEAPGTKKLGSDAVTIDISNTADGYLMVRYLEDTGAVIKAIVQGPSGTKYTYDVSKNKYDVLPLSDGNGNYTIGIYKNIEGTKYSVVYTGSVTVSLKDQFAPFLYPNQYVNFSDGMNTVKKAAELTAGSKDRLSAIKAIYTFVVENITYDKQRAATVQSGYLPDLDSVLAEKKGICFDYASLMTAMLRSLGIPTKLVIGYSGTAYHAWISTYSEESGWISGVIFFDGKTWKLMDPTYASSAKSSEAIMKYIGNGSNYTAKYLY